MKKLATQTVVTMMNGSRITCNSHEELAALKGEEVSAILITETFKGTPAEKAEKAEKMKELGL